MGSVETYDVVVVGARCAGAPLATVLAREGLRVGLVEQATFPRDTLSSHIFEADGLAVLERLGVTERLRETGVRFVEQADLLVEDFHEVVDWPMAPGDPGGMASVRRFVLDPILADAAERAEEIDEQRAEEARRRAEAALTEASKGGSPAQVHAARVALRRELVRLNVVRRRRRPTS